MRPLILEERGEKPDRHLLTPRVALAIAGLDWWLRRLRVLIFVACGGAFIYDILTSDTLAFGVVYIPLICTALLDDSRRTVWWLTGLAIAMIIAGTFLPEVNPNFSDLIGNRLLSIIAILITAALVHYADRIRACLVEETRRAEKAERDKTEVFANIGYDLRAPLHAIIGLAQVMGIDCQPGQRESLAQVQDASRRLLATVNNLVDLSRFEERNTAQTDPVDLPSVVQLVVDEAGGQAADRNVTLVTDIARPVKPLRGDPWAARRIVENILDNALRFSRSGGTVKVSLEPTPTGVSVTVTDSGDGMPQRVRSAMERSVAEGELAGVGTGLALCRRLADAIGAKLQFRDDPAGGTSATIRFARAA